MKMLMQEVRQRKEKEREKERGIEIDSEQAVKLVQPMGKVLSQL